MPVLPPAVSALVAANLAGVGILGIGAPMLSLAVGLGFSQYVLSGVLVNTIDVGSAGGGVGLGPGPVLAPPTLVGAFSATFTANGIIGVNRNQIILALSNALPQALLSGVISTVNAGVGVGTGIATFIPNPAVSVPLMIASFTASGLIGVAAIQLATAIATGFDQALPSAVGQVVIAGAPSPFPGAGAGIGKII
jgi:hypothetical protein